MAIGDELSDKEYIAAISKALEQTPREGASEDNPEGTRYITISETMTNEISAKLRDIAERM